MRAAWLILVLLFAALILWHEWRGPPLTASETAQLLAVLERNRASGDSADSSDSSVIDALRGLAEQDDGKPYFMVNLIRYRAKALYPSGFEHLGDDPRQADARYSAIVVPELLKRGSYPIFHSQVVGRFITQGDLQAWDDVSIVRYRSRRDMLEMVIKLQELGGGMHKWASIEQTHVFPVHAVIAGFPMLLGIGVLLLSLGALVQWLVRRR